MWTKNPIFGLTCLLNVCFSNELTYQQQLNQLQQRVSVLENDVISLKVQNYMLSILWTSCGPKVSQQTIYIKKENANYKVIIENKEIENDIQYLLAQNEEVKTKIDNMESQTSSDGSTGDVNVNFSGSKTFFRNRSL